MKLKILFIISILLMLWSCEKENVVEKKGEIYVTAFTSDGHYYALIEGAEIFTIPPSQRGFTDRYGTALLTGIEPGTYEVYAVLNDFGSGKSVVKVMSDSLKMVDVFVFYGISVAYIPEIAVIQPDTPAYFSANENIVFSFSIKDKESKPTDINVIVSSDLDGTLLDTHPDAANNVRFETSTLSRGIHVITIKATDKDGYTSKKTISVSTLAAGNIILESAVAARNGVNIQWKKYASADFKLYEVLRSTSSNSEGEVIATFNSIDSISYFDYRPPIAAEVYYSVRVTNTVEHKRISNVLKVTEPVGKVFYHTISDAVHHPTNPLIYIVDKADQKLVVINYETQEEVNSISIGESVGKIAIGNNGFGVEVYVPYNSGFIKIYDAETLNLVSTIQTGLPMECVVTNNKGYIVASLESDEWGIQTVRAYSRSTGKPIISNIGSYASMLMLKYVPNSNKIIAITTNSEPADLGLLQFDDNGVITALYGDRYHGDYILHPYIFEISSNGDFFITGNEGNVYSADSSLIYKGMADRSDLLFTDFAFSKDGNTIYAGVWNTKSIHIIKYPELTLGNEISLHGFPIYLFYHSGQIISLSNSEHGSNAYGVQKIKIE